MRYRFGSATYQINVEVGNEPGGATLVLDGAAQDALEIPLVDDGEIHSAVYVT